MAWKSTYYKEGKYIPGNIHIYMIKLEPKAAHSSEKIGNKIYTFGGWNGRSALNSVELYDLDKCEWSILICNGDKPSARNNHASCCYNEFIYIHGGHDGENWLDDFYEFDTNRVKWRQITSSEFHYKPPSRACHSLSVIGKKIYMYGGYDGRLSFKDIEVYNISSQVWTVLNISSKFIPVARNAHSATVINKKIYIFGGHYQNFHLNDLLIFDPAKLIWSSPKISGAVPTGLRGHTGSYVLNKMYFFGGYDGEFRSNDIYRLTLDDFNITKISSHKDSIFVRQRQSANVLDDHKIIYYGGFEGTKWLNNLDVLDISILEENLYLENSKNNLKINFRHLINNKEHSDIIFKFTSGGSIYAHKGILFTRVEYFRNMFSEYMIEKKSNMIEIKQFDYNTFFQFLEFVYTAEISKRDILNIFKLFELADAYSYYTLKKLCEEILYFKIDIESVIDVYIMGYKCNSENLENVCLNFICKNKKKIYNSQENNIKMLLDYPQLMTKILVNLYN
jgi:N-acetylneuraminic acid mutarotase